VTRSTTRRWTRGAALALSAGAAAIVLVPVPASAAPTTTEEARQSVTRAAQELEAIGEQVNEAAAAAQQQQAVATEAAAAAATAQAQLDQLQPALAAIAQAGYIGTTRSQLAAFLTSGSVDDLVQQLTTLDELADHADDVVAAAAAARLTAEQAQQAAAGAAVAAETAAAELTARQEQLEDDLAGYEADLARLSAADQARVQMAVAGPAVVASAAPAPTAAAGSAVQTALAQLGDAYRHAAVGPDAFDCSGLTMYAYAAAGITLPHSSAAQARLGVPVARADLQPGDLVFFYDPISHVGIYIGNGQMVHASVPGRPVAVTSVDKGGYVGARRVTG
jgi:peptidoglycan DL-endopeptidase CwlO